jgi:hypothetical protein
MYAWPNLIITYNFFLGISGQEFLADLQRMEKYKHIQVVVLSTAKTEEEIEKYYKIRILG